MIILLVVAVIFIFCLYIVQYQYGKGKENVCSFNDILSDYNNNEVTEIFKRVQKQDEKIKVKIAKLENEIQDFLESNIFEPVNYERDWLTRYIPENTITEEEIQHLLSSKSLSGVYGVNLLNIKAIPVFPHDLLDLNYHCFDKQIKKIQQDIDSIFADIEKINSLKEAYNVGEKSSIEEMIKLTFSKYPTPKVLERMINVTYQSHNRIILIELEIPNFSSIMIMKKKTKQAYCDDWIEVSAKAQKNLQEDILYSLIIRAGYLAANTDINNYIDIIVVNIRQSWFDRATGIQKTGIIASLQGTKDSFKSLWVDRIDPKACFKYFKGIITPSMEDVVEIKPIYHLDMNDERIIKSKDVSDFLDPNANLAEMPWDDFEHLVGELFEWEFGDNGMEVKITCASRDRGVDAIMFDTDPLKGGKYVLQAKRYNRTVDVAAVRDLYGTIVNEGANRGILVTTSSYGPDTYEFAKNKPISLVDGNHLVQMLKKHGKNYHIKLAK